MAWRKIQFVLFGVTSFVGQTKQVGQYWLIIKENGTNCVNFVGNCVKFVENVVICLKFVLCFEKFLYVRKFFLPLKWYTDQNFFGDGGGGGEVVENNFLRKNFFGVTKYRYFGVTISLKIGYWC